MNAAEIAKLNVEKRQYQKAYLDYWRSTVALTDTGRPVDGLFCAVAPHAAVIPGQYRHVGYTTFVNVLDYPSVAIPVTYADKEVDPKESRTDFLSEKDKEIFSDCEFDLAEGT
jgi:amidase